MPSDGWERLQLGQEYHPLLKPNFVTKLQRQTCGDSLDLFVYLSNIAT